jgi:uncharacterized protein (DUF302 family)
MDNENVTLAFVLNSPFEFSLRRIRRAIVEDNLCVAAEIDTRKRIHRAFQIYESPCRILLIDSPFFALETASIDRASGVFLPLHLVVSAADDCTLVHMLASDYSYRVPFPIGIRSSLTGLQHQLWRTMGRIADGVREPEQFGHRGEVRTIDEGRRSYSLMSDGAE